MKNIFKIIFTYLILSNAFLYSQNLKDITIEKKKLENQKKELLHKISLIDSKIESLASKIIILEIKEKATTTLIRKNCSFYKTASSAVGVIDSPKIKDTIFIIEYYPYGTYYKAIYNNQIGYINQKNIRLTREIKSLKKLSKNSSSISPKSSSQIKYKSRTSRTYYRGSRGGCYYINSKGNKSYVSRSLCN